MIVTGLNNDRLLTGNKIPVTISLDSVSFNSGAYINMTVTKLVTHSGDSVYTYPTVKLYPAPDGISFDLAPYIKSLMPYPYSTIGNLESTITNYQRFTISFSESQTNTSRLFTSKTFIRGFKREDNDTACFLSTNEELYTSEKIPVWSGYTSYRCYLDAANNIKLAPFVTKTQSDFQRVGEICNPFYVRFMNSKGGFSTWLFKSWEQDTDSKSLGYINGLINKRSLGFEEENSVNVETRVSEDYYDYMRDLIVSPVIQVYNRYSKNSWKTIQIDKGGFTGNNYEDLAEFSATFNLNIGNKPSVTW